MKCWFSALTCKTVSAALPAEESGFANFPGSEASLGGVRGENGFSDASLVLDRP